MNEESYLLQGDRECQTETQNLTIKSSPYLKRLLEN